MRLFSSCIQAIALFFLWIYKKLGINGILFVFFLIELPIVCYISDDMATQYRTDHCYSLKKTEEVTKLSPMDTLYDETYDDLEQYSVSIEITNHYQNRYTFLPSLQGSYTEDFDDFVSTFTCSNVDYYQDYIQYYAESEEHRPLSVDSIFPTGTTVCANYHFCLKNEVDVNQILLRPLYEERLQTEKNTLSYTLPQ